MKFLLATYNFFPEHKGGTEHYVYNQAVYLISKGHECEILCCIDSCDNKSGITLFEDDNVRLINYSFQRLSVTGIFLKFKISKLSIYKKEINQLNYAFTHYFQKQSNFDFLELNGFSSVIGFTLIKTLKYVSPNIFVRYYQHIATSCPKGTYINSSAECNITPQTNKCTSCFQNNHDTSISIFISKFMFPNNYLPSKYQQRSLLSISIDSFKELLKSCDEVVVFSKNMFDKIKFINPNVQFKVVKHGIPDFFLNSESNRYYDSMRKNFSYLGRILEIKGFNVLAKAWLKKDLIKNEKLFLAGPMPKSKNSASKYLELLLKRTDVEYVGYLSGQELISFLDSTDFLIVPSQTVETGPLVIHEALSRGCNVLGSNIGGIKELCTYYNQQVFEFNNPEDLKEKIQNSNYVKIKDFEVFNNDKHFAQVFGF
jgi:glycosyltransferase involved in cell wall biosynthesis